MHIVKICFVCPFCISFFFFKVGCTFFINLFHFNAFFSNKISQLQRPTIQNFSSDYWKHCKMIHRHFTILWVLFREILLHVFWQPLDILNCLFWVSITILFFKSFEIKAENFFNLNYIFNKFRIFKHNKHALKQIWTLKVCRLT